ncbi:MAG: CPBP family intramembrane metalloprotease [Flavobacteriaceae bacterium]|nr:CPBP family intramembrane metalloprotease [Flavobacteriaceae bacterium]
MSFLIQNINKEDKWWKYIISVFVVGTGVGIFTMPLAKVYSLYDDGEIILTKAQQSNMLHPNMDKSLYLALMLFTFVGGLLALLLCIKYIHKTNFKLTITTRNKIDWNRFFYAFALWSTILIASSVIGIILSPENYVYNFDIYKFLPLLLVCLILMPLQTSMEEIFFRGYLMQGLAKIFRNSFFPLFITSVMFGLLHFSNPEVDKLGNMLLVYYVATGFFFGIITLMDQGLELSLGLHAANNIMAAILISTDWTVFTTDAIYIDISEPKLGMEIYFGIFVVFPFVLYVLAKKYGWTNWKNKLISKL